MQVDEGDFGAETRTAGQIDAGLLRVLVVDEATGFPVPGAEVAWSDGAKDVAAPSGTQAVSTLVADFDHADNRTSTDARGVAVVRPSAKMSVAARHGDLFGLRELRDPPRGEVRVAMRPGPFVAAKVVTAAGVPAPGIPVSFTIIQKRGRSASSSTVPRQVVSRSPDGLAIAHHPAVRPQDFEGEVEIDASLAGSTAKERLRVPLEKLKEGPITITVPLTGRLIVKILDPVGNAFLQPATVTLEGGDNRRNAVRFVVRTETGSAEFPFAPARGRLTLTASTDSHDTVSGQAIESLPPGADLTVEVRFRKKRGVLVGRAVDESGSPLGRQTLDAEVTNTSGAPLLPSTARVDTDASGMFRIGIDREAGRLEPLCQLEIEIRGGPDGIERAGLLTGVKVVDSDETQLGDVRLVRPEALASGVVVDEAGKPVEGALVRLENYWPVAMIPNANPVIARTRTLSSPRARSDSEGKFEIVKPPRQRAKSTPFSVRADIEGYTCVEAPSGQVAGVRDLRVVMRAYGRLEGSLRLPEPAPIGKLEVRVTHLDSGAGSGRGDARAEDCVESDGRFRMSGLRPGNVNVAVWLKGSSEPLVTIRDVEVPRLGVADDPRLRDIDLTANPALGR